MSKDQEIFLDHFARLGVFNKVAGLAGPDDDDDINAKHKDRLVRRRPLYFPFFVEFFRRIS